MYVVPIDSHLRSITAVPCRIYALLSKLCTPAPLFVGTLHCPAQPAFTPSPAQPSEPSNRGKESTRSQDFKTGRFNMALGTFRPVLFFGLIFLAAYCGGPYQHVNLRAEVLGNLNGTWQVAAPNLSTNLRRSYLTQRSALTRKVYTY